MNKNSLKQYLSNSYQGADSFLREIIFPIFGEEDFEDGYETELLDIEIERRQLATATGIRSVKQLGHFYVGVEPLYLFDITVSDHVLMRRNRVGIQRLIRSVMDQYSCAFMVFHYDDVAQWNWRFSFCQKKKSEKDTTDSKRYTFLLGPGQSCRTARDNFWNLYERRGQLSVEDIQNAFSVEALSNEFFDKYKKHYEDILLYVTGKRYVKKNNKWVEEKIGKPCLEIMRQFDWLDDPEKAVRDYVKKLMGRIVFLLFLQKKGWLGVPAGEPWGNGDGEFIQNLFARTTDKDNFIDNVLEILFDDLNTEREGDISKLSALTSQPIKVPYLNGGLFERDAADDAVFPLPAQNMQSLLDFFSEYNFTIDENDPNDAEVGVDPEMLGRIFENLLEDNKDKGAYYTPKEIVQYMCRESLIGYLQTKIEDEPIRSMIRQFVTTHDAGVLGPWREFIDERLCHVKICDPAIGSGAFPMGLLKELFQCRMAIEGIEPHQAALIKKQIIQQNIYGVDIERGAVDIARLRFWLSLVVDEETPQALPNLDFKIMQGNSLMESFEGIDLTTAIEKKVSENGMISMFDNMLDVYRLELRQKLMTYYNCTDAQTKKILKQEINDNVTKQIFEQGTTIEEGDPELTGNARFFLWHTWFFDVFTNGGFDIVIGNPPYGAKFTDADKKALKRAYKTAQTITHVQKGSMDSYSLFIERAFSMLKKGGCLMFIVPISFTSSDALSGVHRLLMAACDTISVSSYAVRPQPVFENAVVNTSIFICQRTDTENQHVFSTKMHRKGRNFNLQYLIDNLTFIDVKKFLKFGRIPKIGSEIERSILGKLLQFSPVSSYIDSKGKSIYYRTSGGRYFKVVTNYSTGSTKERPLLIKKTYRDAIGCALSSNLSFWFYQIYSNNLDWKSCEITAFPLPPLTSDIVIRLEDLYQEYLMDIERNANTRHTSGTSSYNVDTFKEYKIGRSKAIIDSIDNLICPLYGLTTEETSFIKNYEIEFRLSDDE